MSDLLEKKENFNPSLILTSAIDTKNISFMSRNSVNDRLEDYKKAFKKWLEDDTFKKIIFIENSGYDLSDFEAIANKNNTKETEIISTTSNNDFPRDYGKGFGEGRAIQDVVSKSTLLKKSNFFIKVTGRYFVANIKDIFEQFKKQNADVYCNFRGSLKFADSGLFGGSFKFLENYLAPETETVNDSKGIFIEHCLAKASLRAISDGFKFDLLSVYPQFEGICGTNNREYKTNVYKKFRSKMVGNLKSFFFRNEKY